MRHTSCGTRDQQAHRILSSRHPVLVCPGNHDVRAAFRRVLLAEPATAGPINQAHRTATGLFVLCDSSIPAKDGGRRDDGHLSDETIAWLQSTLHGTPGDVPVVIAFHHPPVALHSPPVDAVRQFGEQRLPRSSPTIPTSWQSRVGTPIPPRRPASRGSHCW